MSGESERIERAIDNLSDRVTDLRGEVHDDGDKTRSIVREAVRDGIRDVLQDKAALKAFWSSAYVQLQDTATQHTGRFVIGGLRAFIAKGLMFLILGSVIYSLGGWSALVKLWNAIWSSP